MESAPKLELEIQPKANVSERLRMIGRRIIRQEVTDYTFLPVDPDIASEQAQQP